MEGFDCSAMWKGLTPQARKRAMFFAMTFVIIIIIILITPDRGNALIIVGLMLGFGAACLAAGAGLPRKGGPPPGPAPGPGPEEHREHREHREGFFPAPGAPAPYAVASSTIPPADAGHYPGAIDIDEYDTEGAYGHRDTTEGDADAVPVGNPYNTNRVAYPPSADACVDDEANDGEIDADELNTYHARSRNDATRVTAGTMNRRKDLEKYFLEEVAQAEDREWWGRSEE